MDGQGKYAVDTIGTPQHDEAVLRAADERMRRLERRSILRYGTHCLGEGIGASLRQGMLFCLGCGAEFNRNNAKWHGDAAVVLALTVYEMDDGNAAEAGRCLSEAMHERLDMPNWDIDPKDRQ